METLGGFALHSAPATRPAPLAALGLAKPSRGATLPAKPAGSACDCIARREIVLVQLVNNAGYSAG
ncbi:MAG TPA: hypothetical protein VIM14_16505, partial [Polyangia bacterium]